jgi:hypothetical protein
LLVDVAGVSCGVELLDEIGDVCEDVDTGDAAGELFWEVRVDYAVWDLVHGECCDEVERHATPDSASTGLEDE